MTVSCFEGAGSICFFKETDQEEKGQRLSVPHTVLPSPRKDGEWGRKRNCCHSRNPKGKHPIIVSKAVSVRPH